MEHIDTSQTRRYVSRHNSAAHGFTLVELMVGLAIGLVTTLAITQILLASEGQKRSLVSGSEAQVNGVLAMDTLRNSIQTAGYGYANVKQTIGCVLDAQFNGAAIPRFPANLVPVVITDGAADAPDSIRVLSSSKSTFSIPLTVIGLGYIPKNSISGASFPVASTAGVMPADLLIAFSESSHCQVFQATSVETAKVNRITDNHWNTDGFPSTTYPANSTLIDMGTFDDVSYSVGSTGSLLFNSLQIDSNSSPSYSGNLELYSNIVNMQAYYGKASTIDGATVLSGPIDTWNTTTPTTNAQWQQVLALRVALVSRSEQYEKDIVTTTDPLWDIGTDTAITGSISCGSSNCIVLKIPRPADSTVWQHYRYKVFSSIIPIRNMLWSQ